MGPTQVKDYKFRPSLGSFFTQPFPDSLPNAMAIKGPSSIQLVMLVSI